MTKIDTETPLRLGLKMIFQYLENKKLHEMQGTLSYGDTNYIIQVRKV